MLLETNQFVTSRLADSERFHADRTALIIIDMNNHFCDPQAWAEDDMQFNLPEPYGSEERVRYFSQELERIIPNIQTALSTFRSAGALIVHVTMGKWTVDARDMVGYMHGRNYDFFDSPATSIIKALQPIAGEIQIRKSASSAFTGTGLEFMLRNAGIERVVLCGQLGNGCVLYTLIQSREYGFQNYWVNDAIHYQGQPFADLVPMLVGSRWAKLVETRQLAAALKS